MSRLLEFFTARSKLRAQHREILALRRELAELRARNASMQAGMRRCLSCDYRLDFKRRQGGPAEPGPEQLPGTATLPRGNNR